MVSVQERLGFATLARMSDASRQVIIVRDLLAALVCEGFRTIHHAGESGCRFNEALGDVHRHAGVMVRRAGEWHLGEGKTATYLSVSKVTTPSLRIGRYDSFWGAVFQNYSPLVLCCTQGGWGLVEIRIGQQLAQQHLKDQLEPDYAALVRRYARCIARHLTSR